ncbi:MAG: hypothetical protein J6V98_05810 [Bacteroidales bacterium]|nr:hypothetical protein [Bacteroidales bacterium]
MATNKYLNKIDALLHPTFKDKTKSLREEQANMSLDISDRNVPYVMYSFDKIPTNLKSGILQPYFRQNKASILSMCDYFIFCFENGKLYVLLVELKHGKDNVTKQLYAGRCFAKYIVDTLNRVEKINLTPHIRLISIRNKNICKKGLQMKPVKYDKDNFCTFEGNSFQLLEFLK